MVTLAKKDTTKPKPKNKANPHILLCKLFVVVVGHCTVLAAKAQRRSRIQGSPELLDLWKASHVQDTMLCGLMTRNRTL